MPERMRRSISRQQSQSPSLADPRVLAANDALLDQLIEHGDAADGVPLSDQLKDKMDQIGVPEGTRHDGEPT